MQNEVKTHEIISNGCVTYYLQKSKKMVDGSIQDLLDRWKYLVIPYNHGGKYLRGTSVLPQWNREGDVPMADTHQIVKDNNFDIYNLIYCAIIYALLFI